jgi:hypothetical protein
LVYNNSIDAVGFFNNRVGFFNKTTANMAGGCGELKRLPCKIAILGSKWNLKITAYTAIG